MSEKVKEYALQQGFKEAELLGFWKDFEVYGLFNPEDVGMLVGLPNYLLVQDGNPVEMVWDPKKTGEITSYLNDLRSSGIEDFQPIPRNLSPQEFAIKKGQSSVRLLGKFEGYDIYSMYSPTDEWIENGRLCFLLVKDGVVVETTSHYTCKDGVFEIIERWDNNEFEDKKTEDYRLPHKKVYSEDEMEKIAGNHVMKPCTREELCRLMDRYGGVFGDCGINTFVDPDSVNFLCFALRYCVKTEIPLGETSHKEVY